LTYICWIAIQLGTFLGKQLKLNGESAKKIKTTFAFPYVSYLLYDLVFLSIFQTKHLSFVSHVSALFFRQLSLNLSFQTSDFSGVI